MTETHLSSKGIHDFRLGLRLGGSGFSLHHGHPVPLRPGSAVAGQYSGVGFVSSFPGRASPHDWPPELFQTSRVHVANFLVNDFWVLGGVMYGFATDKARTMPVLDELLDRVLAQRTGPRFVSGDWNLEPHQLSHFERLRQEGFIDTQDLRYARFGVPPAATCKRCTRKDFLFVSRSRGPAWTIRFGLITLPYWQLSALLVLKYRAFIGACRLADSLAQIAPAWLLLVLPHFHLLHCSMLPFANPLKQPTLLLRSPQGGLR